MIRWLLRTRSDKRNMSVNEYDINMPIKINTNIRNDSFQIGDVVFSATPVFWITSLKDISTIDEGCVSFLFIVYIIRLCPGRLAFHSSRICALMTKIKFYSRHHEGNMKGVIRTFENEILFRRHCSALMLQMTANR